MNFSREKIDEIKSKVDYFEWYKKYLPDLQIKGNSAWCCCNFHGETKPSLQINLSTGMYRCWGCQKYGDIFTFYKDTFNVSFSESVQTIAEEFGVTLEVDPEVQKEIDYKKSLYNINKIMSDKYQISLKNNLNAWNYLTQIRNISPKIIKEFDIGCGINKLPEKDSLKQLGLLVKNENNEYYSKFRSDRIVIPYKNEQGNITSFVGRLCVEKDGAKYMYTTDTLIHKKSNALFGIYQAKKYIKHFNSVILAEGQLDMISMYQKGICNCVATGGLNISDTQINILKKYTSNFYICLEDEAILRGDKWEDTPLDKFYRKIRENIPYAKVYIIDLRQKDGSKCDPDMYLQTHSKDDFKELVKHAPIYNEFVINQKLKNVNPKNIEEKVVCINTLLPILSQIDNFLTRKMYIELVSNKLLIPENDIYKKLKFRIQQEEKLKNENITYDSRPVFAQKILLSTCFAPNFNNIKAKLLISVNALDKMQPLYKKIFQELLSPYIDKYYLEHKKVNVDYSHFFSDITYNDNINEELKKIIIDIYMKAEMLEDFEDSDLDELIGEQIETLDEYVFVEPNELNYSELECLNV